MRWIRTFIDWRYVDWPLIFAVLVLIFFGLTVLFTMEQAGAVAEGTVLKQTVVAVVSLLIAGGIMSVDFRSWRGKSLVIYLISILLLGLVLVFGELLRGTRGWFVVGPISFQPVELARLSLLLVLSSVLSAFRRDTVKTLFAGLILIGIPAVLVLMQPDFGSASTLVLLGFAMMLASGAIPRKIFISALIISIVLGGVLWNGIFTDVQKERVLVLLEPARDPLGRGYNVRQALIAIGSGGVFGQGLGFGSQSVLKFLPEASTDFIFAVIGEALGFVGIVILLGANAVVFWRMFRVMERARDHFHRLLGFGVIVFFIVPTIINVGMNLGLLPVTGLPLPFVSRGGSALLASCIAIAFMQSIAIHERVLD